MGLAKLGKRNSMTYRRSRFHHRPNVLLVEQVYQFTDRQRLAPLGTVGRRVTTKPDGGERVGGGLTSCSVSIV